MAPYDKSEPVTAEEQEKVEPVKEPETIAAPAVVGRAEPPHPYDAEYMRRFGCTYVEAMTKGLVQCDCTIGRSDLIMRPAPVRTLTDF